MKKIFDLNIFDGVKVKNQKEFELFCAKYPDFSKSYLKAGVVLDLRNEYEEIFGRFAKKFPVKGFTEEIRISDVKFTQRIWELEIFNSLDSLDGELLRLAKGYDFTFSSNNSIVNIECVAPEAGNDSNPMKITRFFHNTNKVQIAPSDIGDRIALRIVNSLSQKLKHKNQAPDLVNPYIIAINTANLDWDWHRDPLWIYQVLFALHYPKSNNSERLWNLRGADLGFFATDKFENLSAVIFSNSHPNEFRYGNPNNRNIYMVHNPYAINLINRDLFKGFTHVEFNPNSLEINDGIFDPDDVPLGTIINI